MKIWWRQQESLFAAGVFLVMLVAHFISRDADLTLAYSQAARFKEAGVPYNYFLNSLCPVLLLFAVPATLLITLNSWLIPRFAGHRHRVLLIISFLLASWFILSAGFSLFHLSKYQYLAVHEGSAEFQLESRKNGVTMGNIAMLIYSLYLGFRESMIMWLERTQDQSPFRIMVCNRITLATFAYLFIMISGITFGLFKSDGAAILYLFVFLPVIIICLMNVYLILPRLSSKDYPLFKKLLKLAIVPAILTFSVWMFYTLSTGHSKPQYPVILFIILYVIATPLSWLFYIQQREKINSLLNLEKKLGRATADLAFLRSQINPHFLFNTLNTLYGTALQEQATRTASGIQRLGDMMRFLLHDNHRDTIPVIREVEYLQHYINLQSLRIANTQGIRIETSISDMNCDHSIAPMLLIPFVENAFKHGISLTKPSYVMIKLYCDEKGIYLDVVNSRHTNKENTSEEGYSGVGMENVKQRLALLYPNTHSLKIHEDDAAFEIHLFIRL
ncbi:MAG: hypothetical protein DI535_04630 [Citrobacter freundii]|nr:MAG: hypothetical protein DI535_04630 [Citrobacter freundii]